MPTRPLCLLFAALLVSPLCAFAAPPASGGPGAGASAVQRALADRQRLLPTTIPGRAATTAGGSAGPALPGPTLPGAASAARGASAVGSGSGSSSGAGIGHRVIGAQAGTGRLGSDAARRSEFRRSTGIDRRPERTLPDQASDVARAAVPASGTLPDRANEGGTNRFAANQADRLLAIRLAQIDKLRETALENGDEALLDRADELERIARQQFARRTDDGTPSDRNTRLPLRPSTEPSSPESPTTPPDTEDPATPLRSE